jgi:hypothetical protein
MSSATLVQMLLTVRVENPLPTPASAGNGRCEGRDRIYPHRSVRFLPPGTPNLYGGIALATLITLCVAIYAVPIMETHSALAALLARAAGLPVTGWAAVAVFPGLEPATAPVVTIPAFREVGSASRFLLIGVAVVLLAATRRFSLFRNFGLFLIVLLFGSAIANSVFEDLRLSSITFGQIWLRQELLVWLLLPWALLLLFILPRQGLLRGLGWVVALHLYGFGFSALRMVFVLGMLHHTGTLFLAPLWFLLGTLSDLLFVLFFYSLSIHRDSGKLWGARSAWQSHF